MRIFLICQPHSGREEAETKTTIFFLFFFLNTGRRGSGGKGGEIFKDFQGFQIIDFLRMIPKLKSISGNHVTTIRICNVIVTLQLLCNTYSNVQM